MTALALALPLLLLLLAAVPSTRGDFDQGRGRKWYCKRVPGDAWFDEVDRYYRAYEETRGYILYVDKVQRSAQDVFPRSNGYYPFVMRPRDTLELWQCRMTNRWPSVWNLMIQCERHWEDVVHYEFEGHYYTLIVSEVNRTRAMVKRLSYGPDCPVVPGKMDVFDPDRYYVTTARPSPEVYLCRHKNKDAEPEPPKTEPPKTATEPSAAAKSGRGKLWESHDDDHDEERDPEESLLGACVPEWLWIIALVVETVGLMIALGFCLYKKLLAYVTPAYRIEYQNLDEAWSEELVEKQRQMEEVDSDEMDDRAYIELISQKNILVPEEDVDLR